MSIFKPSLVLGSFLMASVSANAQDQTDVIAILSKDASSGAGGVALLSQRVPTLLACFKLAEIHHDVKVSCTDPKGDTFGRVCHQTKLNPNTGPNLRCENL